MKLLIAALILISFSSVLKAETTLLFMGDSLTEGYGVAQEKSYPSLVAAELIKRGKKIKLLNGSVSGSTTASGMGRLRWFLKAKPDFLILALGANDGLRGIKVSVSKKNLKEIIIFAKSKGIKVVLAGMLLPVNYGPKFRTQFREMYKELVKELSITEIPFLLKNVGGEKDLNQADGIHPNEKGHLVMSKTVIEILGPLL